MLAASLSSTDRQALKATGSCYENMQIREPHVAQVAIVSPSHTGISNRRMRAAPLLPRYLHAQVAASADRELAAPPPMAAVVLAHDASIGAAWTRANRIIVMEGSSEVRSWLRCYRCWSQNLELQVHYEGIHRIDADTGERGEVVDEMQEAVVQCLDCMHDQPHLGLHNGRVEPVEDSWERMIAGAPWVASCTVTVDAEDIETCSGPEAGDALSDASFGDHGTREFFTHVRFHKHYEDRIVVHLLVELYARSAEEATDVLEEAARGTLAITSLAEESRPPASTRGDQH